MNHLTSKIKEIVFEVIKNNSEDLKIIDENTLLLSEGSSIDSMTIVSIVVDLEQELSDFFKKDISLSDDRAMSREVSPYENVKNMIEYISELL